MNMFGATWAGAFYAQHTSLLGTTYVAVEAAGLVLALVLALVVSIRIGAWHRPAAVAAHRYALAH